MGFQIDIIKTSIQCSKCDEIRTFDLDIYETILSSEHYSIDFSDMTKLAHSEDYLVYHDNEGYLHTVCSNCTEKERNAEGLPTVAEHNPSLRRK